MISHLFIFIVPKIARVYVFLDLLDNLSVEREDSMTGYLLESVQ